MPKMTDREKQHIRDLIDQSCGGTPLQPHREFAAAFLGQVIIGQIENWETVQAALVKEDPTKG
jgi:hypothetical protein